MKLKYVNEYKSIDVVPTDAVLPDFVVVSGLNGSGKTQLLEALATGAVQIEGLETQWSSAIAQTMPMNRMRGGIHVPSAPPLIKFFPSSELAAVSSQILSASQIRQTWSHLLTLIAQAAEGVRAANPGITPAAIDREVCVQLVAHGHTTAIQLERLEMTSGKAVTSLSDEDMRLYGHPLSGLRDPFGLSASEIFLAYHERKNRLELSQWRHASKGLGPPPPSDDEFLKRYGPPPWELLNGVLSDLGLPFKFNNPTSTEEDYDFQAVLQETDSRRLVQDGDLSSGERTLLAIGLGLYGALNLNESVGLPRLLLMDEPDATLHPSMVASLLKLTNDIFVDELGVKVIITTHSPTTVALAPECSLHLMRRSERPRLVAASSRDAALCDLTVGIPTLSVTVENRRQVFVESEYDEACYQESFRSLRQYISTELSLEFIAAGKGSQNHGGAEAVKHLVKKLRNAGNVTVSGIIDGDGREGAPPGLHYVPNRYSLENLVLDPVPLGAFLLRERLVTTEDLGLSDHPKYFELGAAHAQRLVDYVTSRIAEQDDDVRPVSVGYVGNFRVLVPRFYLSMNGHLLESRLCETFPQLKTYKSNLKLQVIQKGIGDLSTFAPLDLVELFMQVLAA